MTRVFSGIKPSGEMQLGNYVGAVRRWVDGQPPAGSPAAASHDAIYCVVDLHAMTVAYDPPDLRTRTREIATLLFAAGLDPQRSLVFVQSHVAGAHAECTWFLNCIATFGELRRMTQFKEKSDSQESVSAGLLDYPVLMAADILLYDTEEVPVGDDQRQHVELTRDLAIRFNHRFGETFVVPKASFSTVGARVMDLQEPTAKMSKSSESPQGTVLVLDPPETIEKKVRSAVTDSGSEIRYDPDEKPGVSNLLDLYAAATEVGRDEAVAHFAGSGYGALKSQVADAVVEYLRPVRERNAELSRDPGEVDRLLARGADAAEEIATGVLERVRDACGLLPRRGTA
jgi:tryptophanyl-tRNA synthetase